VFRAINDGNKKGEECNAHREVDSQCDRLYENCALRCCWQGNALDEDENREDLDTQASDRVIAFDERSFRVPRADRAHVCHHLCTVRRCGDCGD
jgi:hypothetical protein